MTIVVFNKWNSWPLMVNLTALWREMTEKGIAEVIRGAQNWHDDAVM